MLEIACGYTMTIKETLTYMADILIMEMDPVTGAQPMLKQVFEFD